MGNNALANREQDGLQVTSAGEVMEQVIAKGDLSKLTPAERSRYYVETCRSMGLNPLTQPFQYIVLNQQMRLYATRTATDQLRTINKVSLGKPDVRREGDLLIVSIDARTPDGRTDSEIGAVNVKGLFGEALANAMMKAMTKAKRRVTLSIVGLGWLDESEVESIQGARLVNLDSDGEIQDSQPRLSGPGTMGPVYADSEGSDPDADGEIVEEMEMPAEPGISEQQMRRIHAIGRDLEWDHDQIHAELLQRLGMPPSASLKDLTFGEGERCIQWMERLKLKRAGAGAS